MKPFILVLVGLRKVSTQPNKIQAWFLQEDAPVRLGVGKNMANSIRYWCNAFKVLEEDSPSNFGDCLLGNDGWDP